MFRRAVYLIVALALFCQASLAAAGSVAVIVNSANENKSMSVEEIKRLYTNAVLEWPDGTPVVLYDLAIGDPARAVFSETVLRKDPMDVAQEWAHLKITNQAKNPPVAIKSEALVVRRVAREKGAIGYVTLEAARLKDGVRIVNIFRK